MQTQLRFAGMLTACRCGKQPKFYEERRHYFAECSICSVRTPKLPTMQEAVQSWEDGSQSAIQVAA